MNQLLYSMYQVPVLIPSPSPSPSNLPTIPTLITSSIPITSISSNLEHSSSSSDSLIPVQESFTTSSSLILNSTDLPLDTSAKDLTVDLGLEKEDLIQEDSINLLKGVMKSNFSKRRKIAGGGSSSSSTGSERLSKRGKPGELKAPFLGGKETNFKCFPTYTLF